MNIAGGLMNGHEFCKGSKNMAVLGDYGEGAVARFCFIVAADGETFEDTLQRPWHTTLQAAQDELKSKIYPGYYIARVTYQVEELNYGK